MRTDIEKTGFIGAHEQVYNFPVGQWPKDPLLKEAGRLNYHHWSSGLEGWGMWLLTKNGASQPWAKEDVQLYVAKLRAELKKPTAPQSPDYVSLFQYLLSAYNRDTTDVVHIGEGSGLESHCLASRKLRSSRYQGRDNQSDQSVWCYG